MPMFTQPELASYLNTPIDNPGRAALLSTLAEGLVLDRLGDSPGALVTHVRVKVIALEVAARAYRNPEGYVDQSVDDWRGRLPDTLAKAGIFLTGHEEGQLGQLLDPSTGGQIRSVKLIADSTYIPPTSVLPTP